MVAVVAQAGNCLYGVLAYNGIKSGGGGSKIISGNQVIYSLGKETFEIKDLMNSFESNLNANNRTKFPIFHCSLNPHPKDKLSDIQLSILAEDFMKQLGYGKQPYVVFKHTDTKRTHIHIVSVRVDETGKKISDKFEGERAGQIAANLEVKYNLHKARGSGQGDELFEPNKVVYAHGDLKKQIKSVLFPVLDKFSFQSFGELNTLLNLYNVRVEEIRGEVRGKPFAGVIYGALDYKGEQAGPPFKSSNLGRQFGMKALEKQFAKAETKFQNSSGRISEIKTIVSRELSRITDFPSFRKALNDNKLDIVLRQHASGRITGVTFIDYKERMIFKGSRLGKEYSANAVNAIFQDRKITVRQSNITDSIGTVQNNIADNDKSAKSELPNIVNGSQHIIPGNTDNIRSTFLNNADPNDTAYIANFTQDDIIDKVNSILTDEPVIDMMPEYDMDYDMNFWDDGSQILLYAHDEPLDDYSKKYDNNSRLSGSDNDTHAPFFKAPRGSPQQDGYKPERKKKKKKGRNI